MHSNRSTSTCLDPAHRKPDHETVPAMRTELYGKRGDLQELRRRHSQSVVKNWSESALQHHVAPEGEKAVRRDHRQHEQGDAMDQGSLVIDQIDAGAKLLRKFQNYKPRGSLKQEIAHDKRSRSTMPFLPKSGG